MAQRGTAASDPLHPGTQRQELDNKLAEAEKELKRLDADHLKNRKRFAEVRAVARSCHAGLEVLDRNMEEKQADEDDALDGGDVDPRDTRLY